MVRVEDEVALTKEYDRQLENQAFGCRISNIYLGLIQNQITQLQTPDMGPVISLCDALGALCHQSCQFGKDGP